MHQHWELPARFQTIAQASGSDGLIEAPISEGAPAAHSLRVLSSKPCIKCEFAFFSVVASQPNGGVFLASFHRVPADDGDSSNRRRFVRRLDRIVPQEELFKNERMTGSSFRWGARDKLFRYTAGRVEVIRYTPRRDAEDIVEPLHEPKTAEDAEFSYLSDIDLGDSGDPESVISARAASFGSVIENDDGLLIIPSSGDPFFIAGEPTNWRTFPRSIDYRNHLHVVYEDRLEILIFTHDYFVDQSTKLAGIEVSFAKESSSL
jgi:hypothetical protein